MDVSDTVLCYLSELWFTSPPCLFEITRAMIMKKPLIGLLEPDTSEEKGGHHEARCREILCSAEYNDRLARVMGPRLEKWMQEWKDWKDVVRLPTGAEIAKALFDDARPLVWYRLPDFQDVTMRLIAERVVLAAPARMYLPQLQSIAETSGRPESADPSSPGTTRPPVRASVRGGEPRADADGTSEAGTAATPTAVAAAPDEAAAAPEAAAAARDSAGAAPAPSAVTAPPARTQRRSKVEFDDIQRRTQRRSDAGIGGIRELGRMSSIRDIGRTLLASALLAKSRRSVAEEFSSVEYEQKFYIEGEVTRKANKLILPVTRKDCQYHLYVSRHSPAGTMNLVRDLQVRFLPGLTFTEEPELLKKCEHIVVLLTSETWTRHEDGVSQSFEQEIEEAMREGVHRLLVHEVVGAREGDNARRHADKFSNIIGLTPRNLVDARLYEEIAQNVAGDEWREAGLAKMAIELCKGSGSREEWKVQRSRPDDKCSRGTDSSLGSARTDRSTSRSSLSDKSGKGLAMAPGKSARSGRSRAGSSMPPLLAANASTPSPQVSADAMAQTSWLGRKLYGLVRIWSGRDDSAAACNSAAASCGRSSVGAMSANVASNRSALNSANPSLKRISGKGSSRDFREFSDVELATSNKV